MKMAAPLLFLLEFHKLRQKSAMKFYKKICQTFFIF